VEGTESFRSKEKLAFKALRTYLRASLKIGVDRERVSRKRSRNRIG